MNRPDTTSTVPVTLSAKSTHTRGSLDEDLLSATCGLRLGALATEKNYCSNNSKLESSNKSNQNSHEVVF